jgi:hypothetical protein
VRYTGIHQARAVELQVLDLGQELVSGGAGHRPTRWKFLVGSEDLLDQEERRRRPTPEPIEVAAGVRQPVDMVDPEPRDQPPADQAEHRGMARAEHGRVLLSDGREVRDVEEPAVVHAGVPLPPPDREVGLGLEERPVRADAGGSLPIPVPPARAVLGDRGFGALGEREPGPRDPERRPIPPRPDGETARP